MVTVYLEFKTSKPLLATMKIIVLKYLISHKLTFKKQNLYKKFKASLGIFQKKKNKKKMGKTESILTLHTEFFFFLRQNYKA